MDDNSYFGLASFSRAVGTIQEQAKEIERLKKEVANLRELVQAKDEHIACYKTGRCPSKRLFAKLDRLTRLIGEPPAVEGEP